MTYTFATTYSALTVATFSILFYCLVQVVYNLYFHPLRRFPGPIHRATADLFYFLSLFSGKEVRDEHRYHTIYGPVVRVAPNTLSFTTTRAWKDIYDFKPGGNHLEKDPWFYARSMKGAGDIIQCIGKQEHARHRKLISHAFSDAALREQESMIKNHVDLLIQQLKRRPEVDITAWYNFATFDIIGDLALGDSFKALEGGQYHPWVSKIFRNVKYLSVFRLGKAYPFPIGTLLNILEPVVFRLAEQHSRCSDEKVDSRRAKQSDRKDFYSYISRYDDDRGLSDAELKNDMEIIVVAGSETTATLLSGATYLLMKHPTMLKKLESEVRHFSTDEELTFLSTSQLPYLNAIIEESFRLYPPGPVRAPRITKPGGAMIDGHYVPGSTRVAVMPYAASRATWNFHDPEKFVPERWLKDCPTEYELDQRSVVQPFGRGARACIGRNLAMNEIRTVLARMIWNFELEQLPRNGVWINQKAYTLWDKPPLWVKLTPRSPSQDMV